MGLQLILQELNKTHIQTDFCRRVWLCRAALRLVSRQYEERLWADLMDDLARSIRKCSTCNTEAEHQEAISAHRCALEVYTRAKHPLEWARAMDGFGITLMEPYLDQIENLELAIQVFRSALEVRTYNADPCSWAMTQNNLATAYTKRIHGNKTDNLARAIGLFEEILSHDELKRDCPELCQAAEKNLQGVVRQHGTRVQVENRRKILAAQASAEETLYTVGVFDLMDSGGFEEWRECAYRRRPSEPRIVILVSHRWNSVDDPDPDHMQFHGVIRFAIQACMMAMGSTPNVFNNVDRSEVILCPDLYQELNSLYAEYAAELAAGPTELMEKMMPNIQQLMGYLENTIGLSNSILVGNDLAPLTYMIRRIDVWYDYICMPQKPRSDEEEVLFNNELAKLAHYFGRYFSLIIWSKKDMNRAWCFMESIVAWKNQRHSIFCCENSLPSSDRPSDIHQLFFRFDRMIFDDASIPFSGLNASYRKQEEEQERREEEILKFFGRDKKLAPTDLSNDLSTALGKELNSAVSDLRGMSADEVKKYLWENGYRCTDDVDYTAIASAIAEGISGVDRD